MIHSKVQTFGNTQQESQIKIYFKKDLASLE